MKITKAIIYICFLATNNVFALEGANSLPEKVTKQGLENAINQKLLYFGNTNTLDGNYGLQTNVHKISKSWVAYNPYNLIPSLTKFHYRIIEFSIFRRGIQQTLKCDFDYSLQHRDYTIHNCLIKADGSFEDKLITENSDVIWADGYDAFITQELIDKNNN